jgi:hypothetical protein
MSDMYDGTDQGYDEPGVLSYEPDEGYEGEPSYDQQFYDDGSMQQFYDDGSGQYQDGALDEERMRELIRQELAPHVEHAQRLMDSHNVEEGEREVLSAMTEAGVPEDDFDKVGERAVEIYDAEVSKALQEAQRHGLSLDQVDPAQLEAALQSEVVRAFEKAMAEFVPPQHGGTRYLSLAQRYAKEGGPRPETIREMAAAGYTQDEYGNVMSPGQLAHRVNRAAMRRTP